VRRCEPAAGWYFHDDQALSTLDGMIRHRHTRQLDVAAFVVLAVSTVLLVSCQPAHALDETAERVFVLPPTWLMLLSAITTSSLTALLTRIDARPWVKAVLNLVLVAIAAVIQYIVAHQGAFTASEILDVFVVTFLINLGVWLGIIRPGVLPMEQVAPDSGIA
jgi:cytochrome bd-type quinol oxidase subunit 2